MRESICERRRSGVPSFYFTFPQNDASEHVILSAAPQQVHRACNLRCEGPLFREGRPQAGPSLARVPRARSG